MLKQLRHKKTAKKIWITLAVIVVPAFVFWGLGGALRSRQEANFAGQIFGRKISLSDFREAMEAVRNQAIMRYGDNFAEAQKSLNLEKLAWERLVLLSEAQRRHIRSNDQEVISVIQQYPFFQHKGRFDNRIYNEMLRYQFRTQPRAFEEETRQNIMLIKLFQEVVKGVQLTEGDISEAYRQANAEMNIQYIASVPADLAKNISVTDQEAKDYFAKNSLEFKQPLSFNLEYLSLDSAQKTQEALAALNKTRNLASAAKSLGLEVKETGLFSQLDPIPGIGWAPQVMQLVSQLEIGKASSPIQIDKEYYLLSLKERKEPYIPDFESIGERVKEALAKKEASRLAKEKIQQCLDSLKGKTADFANAAKALGLKYAASGNFKFGSYIEGVGASDDFWLAADKLKEGENSGIIEVPSGFYIIKLKSRTPIDEKKFAAEKQEFSGKLLAAKQQECFADFALNLQKKARLYH
jgi:hypothetical protein